MIQDLTDGAKMYWPACARVKMFKHLARHQLGRHDCWTYAAELRRDMNCEHDETFNEIIWPKITRALQDRLRKLEDEGIIRYELGRVYWPEWTATWLGPEWAGDI